MRIASSKAMINLMEDQKKLDFLFDFACHC